MGVPDGRIDTKDTDTRVETTAKAQGACKLTGLKALNKLGSIYGCVLLTDNGVQSPGIVTHPIKFLAKTT